MALSKGVALIAAAISSWAWATQSVSVVNDNGLSVGFDLGGGVNYYQPADNYVSMHHADHASFAWALHFTKGINRYFAYQVGYMNYGFYENDGDGMAICDPSGNCGYPKPEPGKAILNSELNVNNEVENQAYYVTAKFKYPLGRQLLFMDLGASYNIATIKSYVTVTPEFSIFGHAFEETRYMNNHDSLQPVIALGWQDQLNKRTNMTVKATWNGVINMYRSNGRYDGSLYPVAILVGFNYRII